MFKSAKIKLTLWYLAILIVITVSFSIFVYTNVINVTNRALESQRIRLERRFNETEFPGFNRKEMSPFIDPQTLIEIREKTLILLIAINIIVLGISGALSYFLAGKTLKPIEDMLDRQKRFVSDAAHELKTPLTIMKTDLEVTLRGKNLDLKQAKDSLTNAVEEINKLNYLVNRLLSQSKYSNGFKNFEKKNLDIREVINSAVKEVSSLAKNRNIALEVSLKEANVLADKESLQEAFRNLLENAIKYSPEKERVTITSYLINNDVITEIKDKGIGISQEEQMKIFEPFYRSDKSRGKSKISGFGLGLAIVKEIIEHHQGSVVVKSAPGEGSVFTVRIPLAKSVISANYQNS